MNAEDIDYTLVAQAPRKTEKVIRLGTRFRNFTSKSYDSLVALLGPQIAQSVVDYGVYHAERLQGLSRHRFFRCPAVKVSDPSAGHLPMAVFHLMVGHGESVPNTAASYVPSFLSSAQQFKGTE